MPTNPQIDGAWSLQSTNTALQGRLHDLGFMLNGTASSSNITARSGVIPRQSDGAGGYFDLKVLPATPTPNMTVNVNSGNAIINRTSNGPYSVFSKQNYTITLDPANATNPRIDLIVARVYDTVIGDSKTGAWVEAITGTPAGSPTVPATPTGAIALANVAVAANATQITSGNITDVRTSTGLYGALRAMLPGDAASVTLPTGLSNGELRLLETASGARAEYSIWLNGTWYPVWESPGRSHARYARTVAFTNISDNTVYYCDMDTTVESSDLITASVGTTVYNSQFTFQRAGIWNVTYNVKFDSSNATANGYARAVIMNTAKSVSYSSQKVYFQSGNGGFTELCVTLQRRFNVGDGISPCFDKNNGVFDSLNPGLEQIWLDMTYISA